MLTQIYRFPLKSCAGQVLSEAYVTPLGLEHDRRWLIVERDTARFVTGREFGQLVLLQADPIAEGQLHLSAHGLPSFTAHATQARKQVSIWDSTVDAACADEASNVALSAWLGRDVQLVYFDALSRRALDQRYAQAADQTAFSDGYPVLIISQASLDHLNSQAVESINMLRFRTNLVVAGDYAPHAEDTWKRIRIGQVEFDLVKPCVRCVFTTVDHQTGKRSALNEPLNTLKNYRRGEKGITFGMNAILRSQPGVIRLGDRLEIL
jgi:uncharacterized protein